VLDQCADRYTGTVLTAMKCTPEVSKMGLDVENGLEIGRATGRGRGVADGVCRAQTVSCPRRSRESR
jgi:hypothetical protein